MSRRPSLGFGEEDDEAIVPPAASPADPFDLSMFRPKPALRPDRLKVEEAAAKTSFRSREAKPAPSRPSSDHPSPDHRSTDARPAHAEAAPLGQAVEQQPAAASRAVAPLSSSPSVRRRRTGRSAQLNLKLRPETMALFYALADAKGWGLGEAFERAVALLEAEMGAATDSSGESGADPRT